MPGSPCDTLGIDTPVAAKEPKNGGELLITLVPNPASESLTIYFEEEKAGSISIADLTGKIWLTGIKAAGQRTFEASIRHLPAGVYIVSFQSEAGYYATRKLVVQH